jgi:hypothetical protein
MNIIQPDYKEIFESWFTSFNPTQEQKIIAKERLDVCLGCDYRKEVLKGVNWSAYCDGCGCPISKKIFSKYFNPCPKKKWENVDSKYIEKLPLKENQSLI